MVKEIEKDWGSEIVLANTNLYSGRKLILHKDDEIDLHYHEKKDKTIFVDKGKILIEFFDGDCMDEDILYEGDSIRIVPGQLHKILGLEESVLIEIANCHIDSDDFEGKVPEPEADEEEIKAKLSAEKKPDANLEEIGEEVIVD